MTAPSASASVILVGGGLANCLLALRLGALRPDLSLTLIEGEWPGPDEVVVDKETAAKEDFEAGDTIGIQAEGAAAYPASLACMSPSWHIQVHAQAVAPLVGTVLPSAGTFTGTT